MVPFGGRGALVAVMLVVAAGATCSRRAKPEGAPAAPVSAAGSPRDGGAAPTSVFVQAVVPRAAAPLLRGPPPEPSAGAPTWSGKVEWEWWQVGDFYYDWKSPAGKLRFEIVKVIVHEDAGEMEGLIVTARVGGKRTPVVVWPSVNFSKTFLLVKPVKKKGFLGIAIISDWSDGQGDPEPDWTAEIRWDGTQVLVDEKGSSSWWK